MSYASQGYLEELLLKLIAYPRETEWLEFKQNLESELDIGEYISALSNSAAIARVECGYLVWGIKDAICEPIGTDFDPNSKKIGNENIDHWLNHMIYPKTSFHFHTFLSNQQRRFVILEIPRAIGMPVQFQKREFIRCGSHKHKLSEFPNLARDLWAALNETNFEQGVAMPNLTKDEVLRQLDYPAYFYKLDRPLPNTPDSIINFLVDDGIVTRSVDERLCITNFGAILFARNLDNFRGVSRKSPRVIQYIGNSKLEAIREEKFTKGYAIAFDEIISLVQMLIPSIEEIGPSGIRKAIMKFPDLAVREIIANALIHQDFTVSGTGTTIEIFDNRIEVTNPGRPLVNINRIIDSPPKSRNEGIASFLRRIGICEERGSGFDKVVSELERFHLPPPEIREFDNHFVVILSAQKPYNALTKKERLFGCYLHACIQYVKQDALSNTSLRTRFGIEVKNSSVISRLIKDAVHEGLIKSLDPDTAPRYMRYIPFWG